MIMDSIRELTEYFTKFPGVGPRQARRMVFYALRQKKEWVNELAYKLQELKNEVTLCPSCFQHFVPTPHQTHANCPICADQNRTPSSLLVVEKDIDLEILEKSNVYQGHYFVLGGLYAPLAKVPTAYIRNEQLATKINHLIPQGLTEVILAFSVTPDGDETVRFLHNSLKSFLPETVSITLLGRGLSTGSELEYADPETLRNAFSRRATK